MSRQTLRTYLAASALLSFVIATFAIGLNRRHQELGSNPYPVKAQRMNRHLPIATPLEVVHGESDTSKADSLRGQHIVREMNGVLHYEPGAYTARFSHDAITYCVNRPDCAGSLTYIFRDAQMGGVLLNASSPASPHVRTVDRSVIYSRGTIEEVYQLGEDALEQSFVISQLPQHKEDLVVTGRIATNLSPPPDGLRSKSLTFTDQGREVISISKALAVDNTGKSLALDMSWSGSELSILIPGTWLEHAELPIILDPLIGSPMTIRTAASTPSGANIAYNSVNNEFMTVWSERNGSTSNDIWVQRISGSGALIGSPVQVGVPGARNLNPSITYASSANRYLIAWEQLIITPPVGSTRIVGAILNGNGSTFQSAFTIASIPIGGTPRSAFDGTRWFVTWSYYNGQSITYGVQGTFVSTTGIVSSVFSVPNPGSQISSASVAFCSGVYMIVWANSGALSAITLDTSGAFLTPTTTIDPVTGGNLNPVVCAGANSFLISWQASTNLLKGVVASPTFQLSAVFTIRSDSNSPPQFPSAAWSSTKLMWYLVYDLSSQLFGSCIDAYGYVYPFESFGSESTRSMSARIAWNSATNQMLSEYALTQNNVTAIMGRFSDMNFPPAPVPPFPTGVTALPGDGVVRLSWNAVQGASGYPVLRSTVSGGPYTYLFTSPTASVSDFQVEDGRTYYYVINAANGTGASADSAQVSALPQPATTSSVLFVVNNSSAMTSADNALLARVQSMSFNVIVKSASQSQATDAAGKVLVLLSASINPSDINSKFTNASVPVLTWNNGLFNALGMTGSTSGSDFGTTSGQTNIAVWNYSDPIIVSITGLTQPVAVVNAADTFGWGVPGGLASVGATISGSNTRAAVFSYKPGVSMPGLKAPAKRVGLFLTAISGTNLNAVGLTLFDSAVKWAVGSPASVLSVWASAKNNQITLHWDTSDGATTYVVQKSTSPNGEFLPVGPAITGTSYVDTAVSPGVTYYYNVIAQGPTGASSVSGAATVLNQDTLTSVAITGTRYLRRKLPGDPRDDWNTADFEALVYRNGEIVADENILLTGWTIVGGLAANPPASFVGTPGTTSCKITSNPNIQGPARVTYKIRVIVSPGIIEDVPPVVFSVFVAPQYRVVMALHFPNDDENKRTTRVGYGLWHTNDSTRSTERSRLATDLSYMLPVYWHQATIDYYFQFVSNDINEKLGPGVWNGNDLAVEDARGRVPQILVQTMAILNQSKAIHVYLVHSFKDKPTLGGRTVNDIKLGSAGTGIFLSDVATTSNGVLGHELGHIWGLADEDKQLPPIAGTVNNLLLVQPLNAVLKMYLMTSENRTHHWMSEKESIQSRYYADSYGRASFILGAQD